MNPYNDFSPMYSSYFQCDQNSYQFPTCQDSYPYYHQSNEYQFSSSYDPYNSSYPPYNSFNDHTLQNSYIHDDQPYPSQEQSTQSSELHDILLELRNNSMNNEKALQNFMDTFNRVSTLCDNISKRIEQGNTVDTYEEGEIYEEKDNLITNVSDEEEENTMNNLDLSHQTPLDSKVEYQYDDGVIYKKDGDILSVSFKNIEETSEVSDLDSVLDPYSLDYFNDDFIPHLLDDEYDNDDDIISLDGVNLFDENTKDALLEDVIPNPTIHEALDIKIEDESDSHDLNIKDYNLDQTIEKDVEEPSIMLSTTCCTSEKVIHDESPLLEKLNLEYDDPYMISISNEHNDPPIFPSTHETFDGEIFDGEIFNGEIKDNKCTMSDLHILEDMKIISDSWSTERCVEEIPISLPIIPHTPHYQVHDENLILEDMSYEYHDPFLIKRDMNHSFHIPPLSCMHYLFTKIQKIFSFSFIIFKIKNSKKITLKENFLPENLDYIHWEDDFPIFILVYDLD